MHWIDAYQRGAFEAVRSNGKGSFQGLKKWSEQFCIGSTFLYSEIINEAILEPMANE